jgi:hypothetical protein
MTTAHARLGLRLATAPVALVLAMAMLVVPTTAQAGGAPTPATTASSPRAAAPVPARAEALSTWRCKPYNSPSVVGKTCARLRILNERFNVDYRRSFFNEFRRQTVPFQCSTSKTKTYTFGASLTGEVEAGVIFSKVKVSATASVSTSYTTQDSASATFKVRPRRWAHCERGTYIYDFAGQVKRVRCNASGCRTTRDDFKGHAPSRDLFVVGPGRG